MVVIILAGEEDDESPGADRFLVTEDKDDVSDVVFRRRLVLTLPGEAGAVLASGTNLSLTYSVVMDGHGNA